MEENFRTDRGGMRPAPRGWRWRAMMGVVVAAEAWLLAILGPPAFLDNTQQPTVMRLPRASETIRARRAQYDPRRDPKLGHPAPEGLMVDARGHRISL